MKRYPHKHDKADIAQGTAEQIVSATKKKLKKDFWDIFEIVTRPMAAFLTAIIIAIISYFGQSIITELSLQEQNARLYTELLSRREEAESLLRKDMFKEIMGGFFEFSNSDDMENDLSKKVLKLELLAINFGDSLSLGPLFSEMSKDIERVLEDNKDEVKDWQNTAGEFQKRLRSLAKRVASSQLSSIFPSSRTFSFEVPMHKIEILPSDSVDTDFNYIWPYNDPLSRTNANIVELDGIKREFEISFKNADYVTQSVQVKLVISEFIQDIPKKVVDLEFTLDFFNFPLINNTRLSHNQRFTLILEKFDANTITLFAMVFPGLYASQRDKPFLNEAIQQLSEQRTNSETQSPSVEVQ